MYTQCPECRTIYQIGPKDLQRAHGRVRCGACSTVFDALETLSPERPAESPPPHTDEPEGRREAEAGAAPEPGAKAEAEPEPEPEPQRFDDDTPLEEILASFGGDLGDGADEEDEPGTDERGAEALAPSRAPAGSAEPPAATAEPEQADDLGDEDEWRALLAELELDETTLGSGLEQENAAETAHTNAPPEEPAELTDSVQPAKPTPEDLTLAGEPPEAQAEVPETAGPAGADRFVPEDREDREDRDGLAASAALFDEIVQSGEFAAILGPDSEAAATAADDHRDRQGREEPAAAAPAGDNDDAGTAPAASGALETQPARDGDEEIIDQELIPHRRSQPRTLLWSAAALLLIAALAAQVIHGQRASLATHPDFGPRLQQFYGVFGIDLEPRWDIGALCVESSSGDASAETLQITSVVVHRGDRPQPYPLLQVALTDRWQSVIGSRAVEAGEYLPEDELRDVRMHPGDRVRARARLSDPGSEAAGYELHVCYRDANAGLRCSGACR